MGIVRERLMWAEGEVRFNLRHGRVVASLLRHGRRAVEIDRGPRGAALIPTGSPDSTDAVRLREQRRGGGQARPPSTRRQRCE